MYIRDCNFGPPTPRHELPSGQRHVGGNISSGDELRPCFSIYALCLAKTTVSAKTKHSYALVHILCVSIGCAQERIDGGARCDTRL
eukprot:jgi/Botrbrau1/7041/Bobra.0165s0064.1